jgi:sporulation-control protein spo0M
VKPTTVTAGEEFEVSMTFTNPLEIPITMGVFSVEGPGSRRAVDVEAK